MHYKRWRIHGDPLVSLRPDPNSRARRPTRKEVVAERKAVVRKMYAEGKTLSDMALALGVSTRTVNRLTVKLGLRYGPAAGVWSRPVGLA